MSGEPPPADSTGQPRPPDSTAEPPPAPATTAETVAAEPWSVRRIERRSRRRRIIDAVTFVLLPIVAFATGALVFNNLLMPRLIHQGGEVRVPDLASLTLEQAEEVLRPLGLRLSRAGERFDPSVPRGFVLTQDPPPETPVRGRRRVLVVVSLGEEFSSVPELFGESLRGARVLLAHAGLVEGGVTRAPSDEVGEGLVAGSDPPAESVLPHATPVALLVSNGSGEATFVMPDLVGREIGGVRRQLESMGFRVLTPPAAPSVGAVASQTPPPGSRITTQVVIVLQGTGRIIR